MSLYRVSGSQRYRGYSQGDIFVGELEPQIEARAVQRGSIEIVETGPVSLDATRAVLPRGWIQPLEEGVARDG